MNVAIFDKATGLISQTGQGGTVQDWLAVCASTQSAVAVADSVTNGTHFIDPTTLAATAYPARPAVDGANAFVFDFVARNWVDSRTVAQLASAARAKRTQLLAATDWTQLKDASLAKADDDAVTAYRKALRDITKQAGFPGTVSWPTVPSAVL